MPITKTLGFMPNGGGEGIRTLDTEMNPYNGLANPTMHPHNPRRLAARAPEWALRVVRSGMAGAYGAGAKVGTGGLPHKQIREEV